MEEKDYNWIMNPPKEVYSVRMDVEGVKITNCISWEVLFYDKDLNKNKFTMQYHPSLNVILENFKTILITMGYDKDLSQFFRTPEEINHIRNKIAKAINRDENSNFEFKTICKEVKS